MDAAARTAVSMVDVVVESEVDGAIKVQVDPQVGRSLDLELLDLQLPVTGRWSASGCG